MKCDILTKEMLSPEKIRSTAEKIKHNLQVIHLLEDGQKLRLCNVISDLNDLITDDGESFMGTILTRMRTAYNLHFKLKTLLLMGNDLSAEGVEVKALAELLELLESDDNISLKRTDYHVVIDDETLKDNNLSDSEKYKVVQSLKELANQEVAKLIQQTVFLNIGLDIQKKSEIKMTIMKDRFRQNYSNLVAQITLQKKFLSSVLEAAKSGVDAQGYFNTNNRAVLIAALENSKLDNNVRRNLVNSLNNNLKNDVWDVLIDALAKVQLDAEGWRILIDAITTTDFSSGNGKSSPKLNTSGYHRVKEILDALNKTEDELAKAKARPIRVGVIGTKKAGKSLVINNLINRDFAPSSLLLPTPNMIRYIPIAPGKKLTLDYDGKIYDDFGTDASLKSFILKEFKKADDAKKVGKEVVLPDMIIYYPCDNLNYEVWDTPGPDYFIAGDEHRKITEVAIRKLDVCIFVMDYTKYLEDSEVELLEQVCKIFKQNGKFYSLFVTINKTDEMYNDQEIKSVIYVIDYIKEKLERIDENKEKLSYKDLVIFGTSALQSFYLNKVIMLAKANGTNVEPFITKNSIAILRGIHAGKTEITTTASIIMHLQDHHGIKDPTEREIEAFSGMPQLLRYTQYIGQSKADMEIVNRVIGNCEGQFTIVKSALGVTEYEELSDEAKRYLEAVLPKVNEMNELANGIKSRLEEAVGGGQAVLRAHDEALKQSKDLEKKSKQNFADEVDLKMSNWVVTEQHIRNLRTNANNNNNRTFMNNFLNSVDEVFNNTTNEAGQDVELLVRLMSMRYSDTIQSKLKELSKKITNAVNEINEDLNKAGIPEIVLPKFPVIVDIQLPDIKFNPGEALDPQALARAANDSISFVRRTGFLSTITNFILGPREIISVGTFKRAVARELEKIGNSQIEDVYTNLNTQINCEINKNFKQFYADCEKTQEIYQKIFKNTFRNILEVLIHTGSDIEDMRRNIAQLKEIGNQMQTFFNIWRNIRMED